jgi:ABC-type phosphate/phosphonate transport system substrate-binding protein
MGLDLTVPTSAAPLLLGAVTYDAKVVTIWEGFRAFFARHGLPFDFVLYSHYERQVLALLAGEIHVAWNSPLAWLQAERLARRRGLAARALAMRDSDRDLTSVIVVRADARIAGLADLRRARVAVGASDSPQATLIPLGALAEAGLQPGQDFEVQLHDHLAGKHGDHIGGEREAARALLAGRADAACLLDANLLLFGQEGTLPAGAVRVVHQSAPYDHCNFTALASAPAGPCARFVELLLAMDHGDPEVRPLLDLEGLKAWKPGRTSGYAQLERAVDRFGVLGSWLAAVR